MRLQSRSSVSATKEHARTSRAAASAPLVTSSHDAASPTAPRPPAERKWMQMQGGYTYTHRESETYRHYSSSSRLVAVAAEVEPVSVLVHLVALITDEGTVVALAVSGSGSIRLLSWPRPRPRPGHVRAIPNRLFRHRQGPQRVHVTPGVSVASFPLPSGGGAAPANPGEAGPRRPFQFQRNRGRSPKAAFVKACHRPRRRLSLSLSLSPSEVIGERRGAAEC